MSKISRLMLVNAIVAVSCPGLIFAQQPPLAEIVRGAQRLPVGQPAPANNPAVVVRGSHHVPPRSSGGSRVLDMQATTPAVSAVRQFSVEPQRPSPARSGNRQPDASTTNVPSGADGLRRSRPDQGEPEPTLPDGVDHLLAYSIRPIKIRVEPPAMPTEEEIAADPSINPFDFIDADHLKVKLSGPFDKRPIPVSVKRLSRLIIPVDRHGIELSGAGLLTSYDIHENWPEPVRTVRIRNRFGEQELTLGRPVHLLVPATRDGGPTSGLDHYKCFVVLKSCFRGRKCDPDEYPLALNQEDYGTPARLIVGRAKLFCVPVEKLHDNSRVVIGAPQSHLTFYHAFQAQASRTLQVEDQFHRYDLQQSKRVLVGVPTFRRSVFPPIPARGPRPPAANQASGTPRPAIRRASSLLSFSRLTRYLTSWGRSE